MTESQTEAIEEDYSVRRTLDSLSNKTDYKPLWLEISSSFEKIAEGLTKTKRVLRQLTIGKFWELDAQTQIAYDYKSIFNALLENKKHCCEPLEDLLLRCPGLCDEGMMWLASIIHEFPRLSRLSLSRCRVGTPGLSALCEALSKTSTNLNILELTENRIDDISPLIDALPHLKHLTRISITQTEPGISGADHTRLLKAASQHLKRIREIFVVSDGQWRGTDTKKMMSFIRRFPLHFACATGDVDEIRRLLAAGSNPEDFASLDHVVGTTMHFATQSGETEAIRILVQEGGARLDTKNKQNKTALELARDLQGYAWATAKQTSALDLLEEMVLVGADEKPGEMVKSAAKRFRPMALTDL